MTNLDAIVPLVIQALRKHGFSHDCTVSMGRDPETNLPRVQADALHVSDEARRSVNVSLINILFEVVDSGVSMDFITFVHDKEESEKFCDGLDISDPGYYRATQLAPTLPFPILLTKPTWSGTVEVGLGLEGVLAVTMPVPRETAVWGSPFGVVGSELFSNVVPMHVLSVMGTVSFFSEVTSQVSAEITVPANRPIAPIPDSMRFAA